MPETVVAASTFTCYLLSVYTMYESKVCQFKTLRLFCKSTHNECENSSLLAKTLIIAEDNPHLTIQRMTTFKSSLMHVLAGVNGL